MESYAITDREDLKSFQGSRALKNVMRSECGLDTLLLNRTNEERMQETQDFVAPKSLIVEACVTD